MCAWEHKKIDIGHEIAPKVIDTVLEIALEIDIVLEIALENLILGLRFLLLSYIEALNKLF